MPQREAGGPVPTGTLTLRYLSDADHKAQEFQRTDLRSGDRIPGPAVIREDTATTFLLPGQVATVGELGELHITRR